MVSGHGLAPFVFATGNADKAREALEILSDAFARPLTAQPIEHDGATFGFLIAEIAEGTKLVGSSFTKLAATPEVEETGDTLAENARIKALGLHEATGLTSIADDTGLIVAALGGQPGVRSARYAGARATYHDNVEKLLRDLDGIALRERAGRFVTAIHVVHENGHEHALLGEVAGTIAFAKRGTNTFGYDPVFVPHEGDGRTFGEMAAAEKHLISHRGRASRRLAHYLAEQH